MAQQEVARYERGRVTPSLERLRALIAACGLELTFGLARADHSYDEQIAAALSIPPVHRLQRALRDAQPLRAARARATGAAEPEHVDVLGVLRALQEAGIRYVLTGELAEVLHGSPLLPITGTARRSSRAPASATASRSLITAADGQPTASPTGDDDRAPLSFSLETYGTELVLTPAPAGTQGYDDLRRDATHVELDEDLTIPVASLVDLIRIADASADQARAPALRRTLELASRRSRRPCCLQPSRSTRSESSRRSPAKTCSAL